MECVAEGTADRPTPDLVRQPISVPAEEQRRREALKELLREWELESGPVDETAVAAMTERYFTP